jgi:hypothetical protein
MDLAISRFWLVAINDIVKNLIVSLFRLSNIGRVFFIKWHRDVAKLFESFGRTKAIASLIYEIES